MKTHKAGCKKILVPRDCCSVRFVRITKGKRAGMIAEFKTVRGEDMFVHADENGRVLEIELLGGGRCTKPCQEI